AGCGRDLKEFADQQVENNLLATHERREAIPFFENHGRFFDIDETTTVDPDVVLPLLKRLTDVARTEQWAIMRPDEKDWAFALLVNLHRNPQSGEEGGGVVEVAAAGFPGLILKKGGQECFSRDLIKKKTYDLKKKPDRVFARRR